MMESRAVGMHACVWKSPKNSILCTRRPAKGETEADYCFIMHPHTHPLAPSVLAGPAERAGSISCWTQPIDIDRNLN